MHDVTIRLATMNDLPAITVLAGELGYPTTEAEMGPRLATLLGSPEAHAVLVAELAGEVAGWINMGITIALESGRFAVINGLVVAEQHRGARIGEKLVHAGEAWVRERGLTRVRVRSNVLRERTHGFYERLGYTPKKAQKVFDKEL